MKNEGPLQLYKISCDLFLSVRPTCYTLHIGDERDQPYYSIITQPWPDKELIKNILKSDNDELSFT